LKLFAVIPTSDPSGALVVTIVTPVANDPKAARKSAASMFVPFIKNRWRRPARGVLIGCLTLPR
jgi:hypothetical protein